MIRRFRSFERDVGEATTAGLQLTSLPLDDTTDVQQYNNVLTKLGEQGLCAVVSPTLTI